MIFLFRHQKQRPEVIYDQKSLSNFHYLNLLCNVKINMQPHISKAVRFKQCVTVDDYLRQLITISKTIVLISVQYKPNKSFYSDRIKLEVASLNFFNVKKKILLSTFLIRCTFILTLCEILLSVIASFLFCFPHLQLNLILFLGSYFCFDNPAALQKQITKVI